MPCHEFGRFPCGKCDGCLASRSSDWAVRLFHELSEPVPGVGDEASFITLTYRVDVGDVDKREAQLFLKRLRKALAPKRIRYFLVSEYGDKSRRPHYHAVIFGHDFSKDSGAYVVRKGLYSSPLLEEAWGHGHVSSGSVTPASIRYVTNYLLGSQPEKLEGRAPTFALMSRRPGLGSGWLEKHSAQTYKHDSVRADGFERRPPRYYDLRSAGRCSCFPSCTGSCDAALWRRALSLRRRDAALAEVRRDVGDWLVSVHPDRRLAAAKIWRSLKSMKEGEL